MSAARVVAIIESSTAAVFYEPTTGMPTEQWWDAPATPGEHPNLAVAESFIPQIDQDGEGGKQSCVATSQLNALIARSVLTPDRALEIQHDLATDSKYARWWRPLGESGLTGWSEDPADFAFFSVTDFGVRIGFEHIASNTVDRVSERLSHGYAAVLMGKSALGGHARLAFEPQETPGQIYVHDPKYPETTGLYPAAAVAQFQVARAAIVF